VSCARLLQWQDWLLAGACRGRVSLLAVLVECCWLFTCKTSCWAECVVSAGAVLGS
jgi:hypothetical protein